MANRVAEPLTGRTWTYILYPIAVCELAHLHNSFELTQLTADSLVFGSYPEVLTMDSDESRAQLLREIWGSYLYKDVLELTGIGIGTRSLIFSGYLRIRSDLKCP